MNQRYIGIVFALASVCFGQHAWAETPAADGPKEATGETPVRFVVCAPADKDCYVAARFKDLDGCEEHARRSTMLCESTAKPGEKLCTPGYRSVIANSHCIE